MPKRSLESLTAFHCAPTLAGVKAGNLFTWHYQTEEAPRDVLDAMRGRLAQYGITVDVLCRCDMYALIFVYREDLVAKALTPEAETFLAGYGYPKGGVAEKIEFLKTRFAARGEFPHEVGIFLDYPLEDVTGFIENGGRECKACGAWKVYGDREKALALFERYKRCTDYFCKDNVFGREMTQLIKSAPAF